MLAGVSNAGLNYDIASDNTVLLTHLIPSQIVSTENMATGNGKFGVPEACHRKKSD
jgi:hypothetical protein